MQDIGRKAGERRGRGQCDENSDSELSTAAYSSRDNSSDNRERGNGVCTRSRGAKALSRGSQQKRQVVEN